MMKPPNLDHLPLREQKLEWEVILRERCPVKLPIRVVWSNRMVVSEGKPIAGMIEFIDLDDERFSNEDHYLITVYARQNRSNLRETLCHEWAHAMSWDEVPGDQDHGFAWGNAYRKCYQAVIEL